MEQIKEAVYLINDERYLHLRENGTGVGFATYNKVTGEPLESGQISEKNLPPDGQNTIPAARNWYPLGHPTGKRKDPRKHPAGGHRQAAHLGAGNAAE